MNHTVTTVATTFALNSWRLWQLLGNSLNNSVNEKLSPPAGGKILPPQLSKIMEQVEYFQIIIESKGWRTLFEQFKQQTESMKVLKDSKNILSIEDMLNRAQREKELVNSSISQKLFTNRTNGWKVLIFTIMVDINEII